MSRDRGLLRAVRTGVASRLADLADNETDSARRTGLALVSGAIAAIVASPLLWLVLRASQTDSARAWDLLTTQQTVDILWNSLGLTLFVTVFSILLGVPLAVLTSRTDLPLRRVWTIVVALPLVIPSYIGAFAFTSMFGSQGELSTLFGLPLPTIDGFWGAVLVITLYTYPYVFLTTRAAILSLDTSLIEAARTLNEGRIATFRRVVFPQIRPAVAAGALLAALYGLSDFGTPAFMRVEVFTSAIYWEWSSSIEYAALLSMQLLAVAAVILVIEARVGQEADSTTGGTSSTQIRLGVWKWPVVGGLSLLAFVTLVAPIAIFGVWFTRGTGGQTTDLFHWSHAMNSVYLAAAAAVVACILALPVAYYAARSNSVIARLFERATYVGFAVPGIVIGLALVFFGTSYAPWFHRTVPLLVFAYVVRFLPQAVGITRSAVLQVDDQLTEAARTLNESRMGTFRRVTLPLIGPGVVAGGALVFLTTMKELPATLMLQPIGVETLATIIWSAHEDVLYAEAAIPALVLVVVSGVSMLVLLRQEDYSV